MQISTLTFVYNEEFLLPYFLKHYKWCDSNIIIYDTESSDNTLKILKEAKDNNIQISPFTFPDGMDDVLKVKHINNVYKMLDCDIVLNVDADEFIFAERQDIERCSNLPIVTCKFGDVYRHESEKDIDIDAPIKTQRRHGYFHPMYKKPIIAHTGLGVEWLPGNHICNQNAYDCGLIGAHWANADLSFCVNRRVKNRALRQSQVNLTQKYTVQHHNITEQDVINECNKNLTAPQLW